MNKKTSMSKAIAIVELNGGHSAVIDADLAPYVEAMGKWTLHPNGHPYKQLHEQGKVVVSLYLHTFVLQLRGFAPPVDYWVVLHLNDDSLDCRVANLRYVPRAAMTHARVLPETNTGHRGITQAPDGTYTAMVGAAGTDRRAGNFASLKDAITALNRRAVQAYGIHAKVNPAEAPGDSPAAIIVSHLPGVSYLEAYQAMVPWSIVETPLPVSTSVVSENYDRTTPCTV